MTRKCKYCNTRLLKEDKHLGCMECRREKKGDDPCVRNKQCKYCDTSAKISDQNVARKEKSDKSVEIDDSILDEDDPIPSKTTAKPSAFSETIFSYGCFEHFLPQLSSLTGRMDNLEKKGSSAGSLVAMDAPSLATGQESEKEVEDIDVTFHTPQYGAISSW